MYHCGLTVSFQFSIYDYVSHAVQYLSSTDSDGANILAVAIGVIVANLHNNQFTIDLLN